MRENGDFATAIRYYRFLQLKHDGAQIIVSTVLFVANLSLRRVRGQPELGGSAKARRAHVSPVAQCDDHPRNNSGPEQRHKQQYGFRSGATRRR
jgi:hypothetical protein